MGRRRLFTAYLSGNKQATGDCIREEWVFRDVICLESKIFT
ncbi:MAG: hypothetical protein ACLSDJ_17760 [Butyricimonas faecihominis]